MSCSQRGVDLLVLIVMAVVWKSVRRWLARKGVGEDDWAKNNKDEFNRVRNKS